MARVVRRDPAKDLLPPLLGALASGLAYPLLFPPFQLPALSWVALVPLALGSWGRRPREAALAGAVFGAVATLGVVHWLAATLGQHFELGGATIAGYLALVGCLSAAPFLALAFAAWARGCDVVPRFARPALFAATWVAAEWGRSELGLRSPWTRLGDAQAGSAWLRQMADLTGVYGVSALVALGNASLAELLLLSRRSAEPGTRPREALRVGSVFVALLALACVYGATAAGRWGSEGHRAGAFTVALVQGNVAPELRWRSATASKVFRRYARLTRDVLRAPGAEDVDLIVWPENAIQTPLSDPSYARVLRGLAASGSPLLLGAPRFEGEGATRRGFNTVHLVQPDGSLAHYDKRRLLPFSETAPIPWIRGLGARGDLDASFYTAGERPGLFTVGGVKVGVLICMEALYPELTREIARAGAQLIVNPSNDGWYRGRGGGDQHLQQTIFRAIEARIPIARATTTGVSAIIGPDGAIQARLEEDIAGVLRDRLPPATTHPTVYARIGDAFALCCASACLISAAWAAARQRLRPRSREAAVHAPTRVFPGPP